MNCFCILLTLMVISSVSQAHSIRITSDATGISSTRQEEEEQNAGIQEQRMMLLDLAEELKNTKNLVFELKNEFGAHSSEQRAAITTLNGKLQTLSRRINQQDLIISELRRENHFLRDRVEPVNKMVTPTAVSDRKQFFINTLTGMTEENGTGRHDSENAIVNGKDNLDEVEISAKNKVFRQRRFVLNREVPVAFHAVSDQGEKPNFTTNQAILFETILLNIGGAFHTNHSLFIAEMPGVYMFSASVLSFVNAHPEFSAAIVKNGGNLALIYGHGDNGRHDQGSATVVTQLDAGDEVWVELLSPDDGSIYGGRYTSFTGALLWNV